MIQLPENSSHAQLKFIYLKIGTLNSMEDIPCLSKTLNLLWANKIFERGPYN